MNQKLTCPSPCKTELEAFLFPSPMGLASDFISSQLNCSLPQSLLNLTVIMSMETAHQKKFTALLEGNTF